MSVNHDHETFDLILIYFNILLFDIVLAPRHKPLQLIQKADGIRKGFFKDKTLYFVYWMNLDDFYQPQFPVREK